MSYVEALLAEKYASWQPPGPPDYVAQSGNREREIYRVGFKSVQTLFAPTKERLLATLARLAEAHDLGELTIGKYNREYVVLCNGSPHPLIRIVRNPHTGAVILYDEEMYE